jgi:uncharacterized membrane protein (Fun14 family)
LELFKTTSTIDEDTFIELKKHLISPKDKMIFLITFFGAFALAFGGIIDNATDGVNPILLLFGISVGIMVPIMYFYRVKQVIKINMNRFQEAGYTAMEVTTSFTEDKIIIHNATTGASVGLDYSVICRFAETKNMYTLFTEAEQFVVVNKASLTQSQTSDEFILFIRKKCKIKIAADKAAKHEG